MRRREFLTLLGSGAAAWPHAARAQQPATPVVGFLRSTALADSTDVVTAFRQGLKGAGFVEGQNVEVEYRYADNQNDRLSALAADLIRRSVSVIVANYEGARVIKDAKPTVPIVFAYGGDPVKDGFVASLNRPGGNVTGVVFFGGILGGKRLELLHRLVPDVKTVAMLVGPHTPPTVAERNDVQAAAQGLGLQFIALDAGSEGDIETAFATCAQRGVGAVIVGAGAFLNSYRKQIVALAANHSLPAGYNLRAFATAGGLMSYGPSMTEAYRQAGSYAGRVLNGEKPGDLPVVQSSKFEFVINLKTAKALGLTVPPTLLALADEVIE